MRAPDARLRKARTIGLIDCFDDLSANSHHRSAVDELRGVARPSASAIPPTRPLLVAVAQPGRFRTHSLAQQSNESPAWVLPVTTMISVILGVDQLLDAPLITAGHRIGNRCLLVIRVSGWMREPVPGCRLTPFMRAA